MHLLDNAKLHYPEAHVVTLFGKGVVFLGNHIP
jgi:hypothetical protein